MMQIQYAPKAKPVRRCIFCNMPKPDDEPDEECYNCSAFGNKVFARQFALSKRQPHAVDRRQAQPL